MSSTPASTSKAADDRRLKRHVGTVGLLFTAVGSIIGSGWLFGALAASEQAGPASILSWLFGAIMITFIGLSYAELGTMFPVSGGVVRFPHFAFGSFASYTSGWITWLGAASTYYTIDPREQLVMLLMMQHLPQGLPGDPPKLHLKFYNLVYQSLID